MLQDIINFGWSNVPKTPLALLLDLAVAIPVVLLILTIMEHRIHLNLMHIKAMPKIVYEKIPFFAKFQHRHAVMHHSIFYRQFDYEPDVAGRYENINIRFYQSVLMGLGGAPVVILIGIYLPVVAVVFGTLGFAHNRLWNTIHTQMHMPKDVWFKDTAYFRFVARHHFMHHMAPTKNLNVVLPCADWFFGTVAKPKLSDVREMVRLGYVVPRTPRGKALQPKMKPQPGYTFQHEPTEAKDAESDAPMIAPTLTPAGAGLGAA